MAAYSLEEAQNHLNAWLAADLACSTGQEYKIGSRTLRRADLAEIRKQINYWRNEVALLSIGRRGARVMRIVPRDL